MASKRQEDRHKKAVEEIIGSTLLKCVRSPSASTQESVESVEPEEAAYQEEEVETSPEFTSSEESSNQDIPQPVEEENPIFPSPSLRKVLPDKFREMEEQNRIHVLPKEFKTNIDPSLIPKIVPQIKYIDIIASLVGCTEYKSSLAEFWFLDTMANLLRRAQEDQMPRAAQAVLMLWFCEWMKELQNFDAADRQRMLRRFKDNMLSAARFVAENTQLPTPSEAGVYYKAQDEASIIEDPSKNANPSTTPLGDHLVTFVECAYECAMKDLVTIMHYIFDLFSTDYQFDLVRSIFTFTPEYNLIDLPYQLQQPKRILVPIKPKKEKPKKEPKQAKGKKSKEVDTEDYLALMELKARDERELEVKQLEDAERWNMRNSILPLALAGTDELFNKYWPPPPPEPEPEPEPKAEKGKKKK